MPKDRVTQLHQGYGFVEFLSEEDADYAIKIMNMIKLYGKPIRVNKASAHQKNLDVGANIFIGNLDPEVDEKLLYDTFSAFGVILQTPKIMRDPETGNSKGFAFINFASFEASDAAMDAMNGQYLCNRPITVSYAFKKDSKGERHGSAAERLLAAQNPLSHADRPHTLFADAPVPPMMNHGMGHMPPPMSHMAPPPPPSNVLPPPPPVPPPSSGFPSSIPPPPLPPMQPPMPLQPPLPPSSIGMPPPPRMIPPPWAQVCYGNFCQFYDLFLINFFYRLVNQDNPDFLHHHQIMLHHHQDLLGLLLDRLHRIGDHHNFRDLHLVEECQLRQETIRDMVMAMDTR